MFKQRSIFYVGANGLIMSTNTTGENEWPVPFALSSDFIAPNNIALSVCADNNEDALNGIRVYYGLYINAC